MIFFHIHKASKLFFSVIRHDVVRKGRVRFLALSVFVSYMMLSGGVHSENSEPVNTVAVSNASQLNAALENAFEGSRIELSPGVYTGNFQVKISVTLDCLSGVVLDGAGEDNVLSVFSPNVVVSGCHIQNWGDDLTDMDAGIFVHTSAANFKAKDNTLNGITFGIFVDHAEAPQIVGNRIEGDLSIRSQDRGNGIHLFNVTGADVAGNEVFHTRDGIYIDTSNKNILRDNELHHLRYGIHYMYSYSNELRGNYTHDTRTGYALMQSKYLTVENNISENDRNYGILMNYITGSTIRNNDVRFVKQGVSPTGTGLINGAEGKAIFMYNSLFNEVSGNRFSGSDIGVHLTAGSEDNDIFGNTFVGNVTQVKYVANREQDWSKDGKGNYWSDYLGWDMDNDGVGDVSYEPNDAIDKLLWKYPVARILMNSPAIEMLRWAQRQFPVFRSPGIKDSFPLMKQVAR